MSMDGQGLLTMNDVINVMYHIASYSSLSQTQVNFIHNCCDMNESGTIDILDSINLLYELASSFVF